MRRLPIHLIVWFAAGLLAAIVVLAAGGRVFYISSSSGSNANNGLSQAQPWKSAPYMGTGSGCSGSGSGPVYTPQPGDQFVFKGGDTWPAVCFGMYITSGGTATAQNYFGACISNADFTAQYPTKPLSANGSPCANTTSWPSTGWTHPKFDLAGSVVGTPVGHQVIAVPISGATQFITFDDIEIAHQGIGGLTTDGTTQNQAAIILAVGGSQNTTGAGTVVENMYIHGAVTSVVTFTKPYPHLGYSAGGVSGAALLQYNEESGEDSSNGGITPTTANWYYFMGAGFYNKVIAFNKIHGTLNGCDQTPLDSAGSWSCHDNDLYHVGNAGEDSTGIHSHIVFNGENIGADVCFDVYNNALHDSNPGLVLSTGANCHIFNNVIWNNLNATAVRIQCSRLQSFGTCPSTDTLYLYNNTISSSVGCMLNAANDGTHGLVGNLIVQNNICIGTGSSFASSGRTGTLTYDHNGGAADPMTATEANQYGFIAPSLFSPSSSDPNTVGQGVNLTSSCSGSVTALCFDASGAPWFGGSAKHRQVGTAAWDRGAFAQSGAATGPPTVAITSPTCGSSCTGTQNLTATATPQGSATISNCQWKIDGFTYGPPDTTSPYTTTWDSNTASNERAHTISVVCTDSNNQTGSASIQVTTTNAHPNGFVSDHVFGAGIPNQSITPLTSGTATFPVCIKPFTSTTNDNETGMSQALPTGYGDFSTIIAVRAGGFIQVYNGTTSAYATDLTPTSYPVVAATQYCFNMTINMTTQQYTVAETSPSVVNNIATNFGFRNTPVTSLGFLSSYASTDSTPDTVEVSNFGSAPTLSYNPGDLNFGAVINTTTASLTENVTVANGPATITSAAVAGTGFTLDASSTCPNPSGSLGSACTWVVDFTPSSSGSYNGTLTIAGNQTGNPQVVNLSGSGISASSSATPSPTSINFGDVQLGSCPPNCGATSGPVTMTLVNGPVTFSGVTFDNPDFSAASITCTGSVSLPTCQITPRFTPSVIGNESATMTIHDNAPSGGSTQTVALTGSGVNFPTPAPAVQFVGTMPFSVTIKGKTYNYMVPVSCGNCTQTAVDSYSCSCQ